MNREQYGSYKYQWSRYVARKALDQEIKVLKDNYDVLLEKLTGNPSSISAESITSETPLRELLDKLPHKSFGEPPKKDGQFRMGIVGSGVSGLFTALLIDELNKRSKGKLNIEYDILEASDRVGGRLYTHHFSRKRHDYYDVGAMRFPDTELMNRTFRLFDYVGIQKALKPDKDTDEPRLIRYYLKDDREVCPAYYNDIQKSGKLPWKVRPKEGEEPKASDGVDYDIFQVNKWLDPEDPNRISDDVIGYNPSEVVEIAIQDFTKALREDLNKMMDRSKNRTNPIDTGEPDAGWALLNKADHMSVREFFRADTIPGIPVKGRGWNFNTIEWLETFALATGWYNQSLAETVLETLDFAPPNGKEFSNDYWWCIEGGTQQLAEKMAEIVDRKPELNRKVTKISTNMKTGTIELSMKNDDPREYYTVFNSTTLGALQKMDLSEANLLYGTKQAIRSLNYGASCKVGMKFKSPWWMEDPYNIVQGGVGKTDLPLRVCVYPSYNVGDPRNESAVLLCSYSWAQDAQRIGTLISSDTPRNEEELKDVLLHNLALLHSKTKEGYAKTLKLLKKEYITHHAYDWYRDTNTSGAFAYFGPGQFSQMWPEIIKPNGWLFLIGEAASAHHGWIVGALESSVRAVYQLLHMLNQQKKNDPEFSGYADAMAFLRGPEDEKDEDWNLPFVGLPREIPFRQEGTAKNAEVAETLEEAVKKKEDLSFVAAQCLASFCTLVTEMLKEEQQAKDVQ